ncbi:MAG: response regulator [Terrimicrobiaceae bacterium]|nr:response regulator [Terrimicrobiaceae bacterium]
MLKPQSAHMGRKGILLVDDETVALKYFSKAFAHRFAVFSAASTEEALQILDVHHDEIGVVVTDQRMPESSGVELLRIVREQYPQTVRILTTAYSELELLVEAINTGAVYSFVSKPWNLGELEQILTSALGHYEKSLQDARLLNEGFDELKAKILEDRTYDVGLIAAKIGHYVHNALCPVTLLIDQLLERNEADEEFSGDFLQSVRDHIYEVSRTLKDLAQISVPPSRSNYKSLDLQEILAGALKRTEVLCKQKGLRIESDVAGNLPAISGVASQIEKLFRFMIAEEVVSLPARSVVRLHIRPHAADGGILGVNLEFEDFVAASDETCTASLLHPFNLRGSNPREFGVFLISSYFIAKHHGGSLNARVKEDKGLSFSFFLPCDPIKSADANPVEFAAELL